MVLDCSVLRLAKKTKERCLLRGKGRSSDSHEKGERGFGEVVGR